MVAMMVLMLVLLIAAPHHMGTPGSHNSPGHAPPTQQQQHEVSTPGAHRVGEPNPEPPPEK